MSEVSYTAKQAAEALRISAAQARRYGAALEEVTGEPIARHPRDGRMYRRDQVETMLKAKGLVEANTGLTVAQALTLALGETPELARAETTVGLDLPSEMLSDALERALTRSLLPELQGLRAEVSELRAELLEQRSGSMAQQPETLTQDLTLGGSAAVVDKAAGKDSTSAQDDGPLTRAARWLERRLRGGWG